MYVNIKQTLYLCPNICYIPAYCICCLLHTITIQCIEYTFHHLLYTTLHLNRSYPFYHWKQNFVIFPFTTFAMIKTGLIKRKTGDILYFSHCRQILWKDQQWIDHIIKNCLCSHNKDTAYSPKTVKITWISHTFELSVPCPFVMLNMGTVVEMKQYICDLFLKIS